MPKRGRRPQPRNARAQVSSTTQSAPNQSGRVITHHGRTVLVEDAQGELHKCSVRRRLGRVVCGDQVEWQACGPAQGVIVELAPRHTLLARPDGSGHVRPLAANLDQILIVVAPRPPMSLGLIDRYLVASELTGTQTAILVNKSDLLDQAEHRDWQQRLQEFQDIGYPVLFVSTKTKTGLTELQQQLGDHTSILVGQSGVGKSSLIHALLPDLDIRVGGLSDSSGLGRHTTTATRLYQLPHGGNLIDSPGVRDFHLERVEAQALQRGFPEFTQIDGQCRFQNCRHMSEPGCRITAAVEEERFSRRRFESYQRLMREMDAVV